jgi:polyisoprenoid-binding protein YceI
MHRLGVSVTALIVSVLCGLYTQPAQAQALEYIIDPGHTFPGFEVQHLGISTQRGRFNKTEGKVTLDVKGRQGSIDIIIDTTTIDTGNGVLDRMLKSSTWFNIEKHPKITFKSSKLEFDGEKPVAAFGDLTLLGVTKPVTLKLDKFGCTVFMAVRHICGADASTTIKRTDFGMDSYLRFVAEDVKLVIQVEAVRQFEAPKSEN